MLKKRSGPGNRERINVEGRYCYVLLHLFLAFNSKVFVDGTEQTKASVAERNAKKEMEQGGEVFLNNGKKSTVNRALVEHSNIIPGHSFFLCSPLCSV